MSQKIITISLKFGLILKGGTIKFLVDLLGIDRKSEIERLICEEVNDSVMDYMMAGIEIISGKRGHQYFGVKSSAAK